MSAQQRLAEDIFSFQADPLGFILYAFPWGKKNTPLERFPEGPDQWHRDMFTSLAKHTLANLTRLDLKQSLKPYYDATASGHGIGKSACVSWVILWLMSTRRHCRGVVTANTKDQLEDKTWAELAKWHNMAINRDWFKWTATKFYCTLETGGEKNWCFDAATWSEENTEAFAGLHNASSAVCVIMDEASSIPDKIWEVGEGAMSDGEGFWFAFGNPTRNTGRFRQCFGKFRDRWNTRHVDSRTVRITNKEKLAEDIKLYGEDSDYTRVRIKGQFPRGGSNQFISSDLVEGAQTREVVSDVYAPLMMGIDIARFGTAKTVIRFRQGKDARSHPVYKYRGLDNMQAAYRIAELIDKHNPDAVCIDEGAATGTIDRLRELKYKVHAIQFGSTADNPTYYNTRSEIWGRMRDWLVEGCIDGDQELFDDLIGPEYKFAGKDGSAIMLEAKQEMERRGLASPDDGDALALTFAVRVARRDLRTTLKNSARRVAKDLNYDIFG